MTSTSTPAWTETLIARTKALESAFACGGEVLLPEPVVLRGPDGKRLAIADVAFSRSKTLDKKLLAWCAPASFGDGAETRTDSRVREGRQLYARDGVLEVEGLDGALRDIVARVREALCPYDNAPPTAELHSLNVYPRGGFFVAHKDTPVDPSVFGTLVVCLPRSFGGGTLIVEREARTTFDWARSSWSSGGAREKEDRTIRWAAFFGDVDHSIEPVTDGLRVTLTYQLRRPPEASAAPTRAAGGAEVGLTAALVDALADPKFLPKGGRLGVPCVHLYALPTGEGAEARAEDLREVVKGRDQLVSLAIERAGLTPRVVPYLFETCAGESWRLRRGVTTRERRLFDQGRVEGYDLEETLPIEFHADWSGSDDVTWLAPPPWESTYRKPKEGRVEPAVELLGEVEYSATGYFGNEASYVAFYAAAAILVDVPSAAARKQSTSR